MSDSQAEESVISQLTDMDLVNYKPPAPKSVQEILEADKDDESLRRYKDSLLGRSSGPVVVDPSNSSTVLLRSISLLVDGIPDVELKIQDAHSKLSFRIREGAVYRLKFSFHVQRELVTGLRYSHRVTKMGLPVHNERVMVGSYAPSTDLIHYVTHPDEAPSGLLARGKYKIQSKFSDDYGNMFAKWEWTLEIAKNW